MTDINALTRTWSDELDLRRVVLDQERPAHDPTVGNEGAVVAGVENVVLERVGCRTAGEQVHRLDGAVPEELLQRPRSRRARGFACTAGG